jgi:hypothetical protein
MLKTFFKFRTALLGTFVCSTSLCNVFDSVRAQTTTPVTGQFTCPVSECRINQSNGISNSVGVGVTSSFGVSSSAQSSSNYDSSASASLVLNSFDPATSNQYGYNTSIQAIGSQASDSPIAIEITSETIQNKTKASNDSQYFYSTEYSGEESTTSEAVFNAEGFGAMQDLRFKGGAQTNGDSGVGDGTTMEGAGSVFQADVIKLLNKTDGPEFGTGNSSANAETRTRFQADITTSNFVNAFISSF